MANRPDTKPGQRPSTGDVGNFLGIAGGAAAGGAVGGAIANRPSQLPAERPGVANRPSQLPAERPMRPQDRPNWSDWSDNRGGQWQQRVDNSHNSWNNWQQNNQVQLNNFNNNQDQRWNNIHNAQNNRQNWRDQNREDWQDHRKEMWDYRGNRANEVWDNVRDYHNHCFDDRWWGRCGWGYGWGGVYVSNPWWWWAPATIGAVSSFVDAITPDPVYIDYGMTVVYEGETVYVDNQPIPSAQYTQPMIDLAVNVEQPPPPLPPEAPAPDAQATATPAEEWMPLGVYALTQEEKGDPVMFLQISVNRAGVISGAYNNELSGNQRPIAGQVDKASQRVAWRIGENKDSIFESTLGNLTLDVSPVAIHFGKANTQTWLLVRLPEPTPAGQPQKLPEAPKAPPPLPKKA
ncbi:MAG: mu-protocadherin-cell-suface protein [Verrucomicrobia bacterium]|nr:mu-protocadherin-cell-suface protein [Verrucomicrobiota bacterium]